MVSTYLSDATGAIRVRASNQGLPVAIWRNRQSPFNEHLRLICLYRCIVGSTCYLMTGFPKKIYGRPRQNHELWPILRITCLRSMLAMHVGNCPSLRTTQN